MQWTRHFEVGFMSTNLLFRIDIGKALIFNIGMATIILSSMSRALSAESDFKSSYKINLLDIPGSDNTGRSDNSRAITSAIADLPEEGGIIYLPSGKYRLEIPVVVVKSNVIIQGAGIGATEIIGDLALPAVVQEGTAQARVYNNGLEGLTVGRAEGRPPVDSVGIFWASFNYVWERRVLSTDHYYDRRWDDQQFPSDISIGYDGVEIYGKNAVQAYGLVAEVADVRVSGAEFGRNKGELYSPACGIEVVGMANNIDFEQTWLIPRGSAGSAGAMVCFTNVPQKSSGIFRLENSYGENWNYGFQINSDSVEVKELSIIGGHYSAKYNLFNKEVHSRLLELSIENSNFTGDITIDSVSYSRFEGNDVSGIFKLAAPTGFRASIAVIGNTFSHGVRLIGEWSKLIFTGNIMHEDGSFKDEASGEKYVLGNVGGLRSSFTKQP